MAVHWLLQNFKSESEAATAEEGIFLNGEIKADEKANFAYFAIDDLNWIC